MSKYRFKTKQEFIRDGQWDYENNCPVMWHEDRLMNHFLGQDVPKELNKECDEGSDLMIDDWFFPTTDYILKEENKNWSVWYPKKEINANGFEYFGDTLMEVSNEGESWRIRVVFGKKDEKYIGWEGCDNLKEAKHKSVPVTWNYARPIKTKLTLQEIADKFRLDVNEIEII